MASTPLNNAQEALRIVQEHFLWVIQRKHPSSDEWVTQGKAIKGRTAALEALNKKKTADKSFDYRTIPKNEADKYQEGLNAARHKKEDRRQRRPLLALPENM